MTTLEVAGSNVGAAKGHADRRFRAHQAGHMAGLFQQLMADVQTTAASSASADQKLAEYLENRKISPAIRAQSTLQRIGVGEGRTL